MGIFINNSQRKSDFQLISDLQNQIQNTLSDPNITDDVKQKSKSGFIRIIYKRKSAEYAKKTLLGIIQYRNLNKY